jgi:hypothetical protein
MKKLLIASALAFGSIMAAPASADIVQVDASAIQGFNVLFNQGITSGNVVDGFLNNQANSRVLFTGTGGAILRASGGQASISGDLNGGTPNPNDTIPLNGFSFGMQDNSTFNNVEFNLFGGSATSVNFAVTDDAGTVFNFSKPLGNGSNFVGFQAINGQSIRNVAFTTVGGGIQEVRQIRIGLTNAVVPEPATWAMLIGGFGLVGAATRRRSRSQVTYA